MKIRRVISLLLAVALLMTALPAIPARAQGNIVVTLGANLNKEQRATILRFFGVQESDVSILTITNKDEREHLGGLIPLEKIGTRTFSCAMVCPTESGGIQVKTANLNYVTSDMIAATLSTSGVVNCDVLAASPIEVSGTGALTGVMMAYESASGILLDDAKKELANEELVTTSTIAETIGQAKATLVVNDIKVHIIRDQVQEEQKVNQIVDAVVDIVETAADEQASALSMPQPAKLNQEHHELLYGYGNKVAQMGYNYDDVKVTLHRVAQNVSDATGIDDPILDTMDDDLENLSEDSVLRKTDDQAFGVTGKVNATVDVRDEQFVAEDSASGSGVALKLVAEHAGAELVSGTNLLRKQMPGGAYCLMDLAGQPVTDAAYSGSFSAGKRGITAYSHAGYDNGDINSEGVLSLNGAVLLPCQYAKTRILDDHWAVGIAVTASTADNFDMTNWSNTEFYRIDHADFYWLEGETACLAGSLSRADYEDANAEGGYLNVLHRTTQKVTTYDSSFTAVQTDGDRLYSFPEGGVAEYELFHDNGHQGVKDAQGNILIPADYYSVTDYRNGYARVYDGEHYGVMADGGYLVVPVEYDKIPTVYSAPNIHPAYGAYGANGYFGVEKDGKAGFVAWGGAVTCPLTYGKDILTFNGASAVYTDPLSGVGHIVAADGNDAAVSDYQTLWSVSNAYGMLYEGRDANYDKVLLDWHGQPVFPNALGDIDVSGDGNYLITRSPDYKKTYVYALTYTHSGYDLPDAVAYREGFDAAHAPAAVQTPAPKAAPAEESAADPALEPVKALLDSAQTLTAMDYEGNRASICTLLSQAAAMIRDSHSDAASVLESAVSIADISDAATIDILITTAESLLDI